jgi:diguanylate cyclase (GGDEF)-like protein
MDRHERTESTKGGVMKIARILRSVTLTTADPPPPSSDSKHDESLDPSSASSFLGISSSELTPDVRRAVAALLGEAPALHHELGRTRALLEEAEEVADRDHLLPILNRRAFIRALEREIASIARYATPSTLVYFDLDGFKRINDANGHACGDAVLAHFVALLLSHIRGSDVAGRLGGDEFGLILIHAKREQARRKSASLTGLLDSAPPSFEGKPLPFSFSWGVLELTGAMSAEAAIALADAEMYRRKRER